MKKRKFTQNRKRWFRVFKRILRIRYRKPSFEYLGEKPTNGAIILSNHEGAAAPLNLEMYADFPIRMWGTHEMNSGLVKLYKYQTQVYYHKKRHWNLHLARLFCLIASPLTNLFYKGLKLISTYKDRRFFKQTIKESISAMTENGENIIIFPEMSDNGYLKKMEGFYAGFTVLAQALFRQGIDVKIFVTYFKKEERKFVFDSPISFSELKELCGNRHEMANYLLEKCNGLGESY
ncbi:MAG: hypothetical protein K2G44_04490 [Clostridia bacterium]|nr:hypothetical protein [Clostridia bacterium]